MSEPKIFRDEALEYAAKGDVTGGMLRITPRWTTAGFFALVLLLAIMLAGAATLKINSRASATAHFENGSWRARFPVVIEGGVRVRIVGSVRSCVAIHVPRSSPLEIRCREEQGPFPPDGTSSVLQATVRRSVLSTILGVVGSR